MEFKELQMELIAITLLIAIFANTVLCVFKGVIMQVSVFCLPGFDWSLHFKWEQLSPEQRARRTDPAQPIK